MAATSLFTSDQLLKDVVEDVEEGHKKKPDTRFESLEKLSTEPPELPLLSILTLEPQLLEMLGRLIKILNDPILFEKLKQVIHKKFDLTIHRVDKEITETKRKGGGNESYFTKEECSFFSNSQEI